MPVFQCNGCPQCPCTLFILDDDAGEPTICPWTRAPSEYVPVWREMKVEA